MRIPSSSAAMKREYAADGPGLLLRRMKKEKRAPRQNPYRASTRRPQCANSTGTLMRSSMWRVTPPSIISRNRE
jgi:hypothetical protein